MYYYKIISTLSNKNFKDNYTFIQRNNIVTHKAIDLPILRQLSIVIFSIIESKPTFEKQKIN